MTNNNMANSKEIKCNLDELLKRNDAVFIVAHNRPDCDALGAALGMALICQKKKVKCYIVIDDNIEKLSTEIYQIIEDVKNNFNVIKSSDLDSLLTSNSLMLAVDVNKTYMVATKNYLDKFQDIMIIDHHNTDEDTIKANYPFINPKLSSACEEVSKLLFLYNIKIPNDIANYLLAGIVLDSNRFSRNTGEDTFDVAAKLVNKGADPSIANNMFLEDFEHDRAVQRLVDNTAFPTYIFAIASDRFNSGHIYNVEDIAKAADYLLKYRVNATFAMAYVDEDTVYISARSKGIIDVSSIMKLFGGGGNDHSGAAKIKGATIEQIREKLENILIPGNIYSDKLIRSEEISSEDDIKNSPVLKLK